MPRHYLLFVDEHSLVKVEIWPSSNSDGTFNYDYPENVTVATRENRHEVWGPPIYLKEER
jgi:hypothetical protein